MPYFDSVFRTKAPLPERGRYISGPVPLTAAEDARITAMDARAMLACELRAMMHPDRIAVAVSMDDMQRIVDALEGE